MPVPASCPALCCGFVLFLSVVLSEVIRGTPRRPAHEGAVAVGPPGGSRAAGPSWCGLALLADPRPAADLLLWWECAFALWRRGCSPAARLPWTWADAPPPALVSDAAGRRHQGASFGVVWLGGSPALLVSWLFGAIATESPRWLRLGRVLDHRLVGGRGAAGSWPHEQRRTCRRDSASTWLMSAFWQRLPNHRWPARSPPRPVGSSCWSGRRVGRRPAGTGRRGTAGRNARWRPPSTRPNHSGRVCAAGGPPAGGRTSWTGCWRPRPGISWSSTVEGHALPVWAAAQGPAGRAGLVPRLLSPRSALVGNRTVAEGRSGRRSNPHPLPVAASRCIVSVRSLIFLPSSPPGSA